MQKDESGGFNRLTIAAINSLFSAPRLSGLPVAWIAMSSLTPKRSIHGKTIEAAHPLLYQTKGRNL
jgi:hypothetical protein